MVAAEVQLASAPLATVSSAVQQQQQHPVGPISHSAASTAAVSAFSSCCPTSGESSSIGGDSIELSDSQGNNNTMYKGLFEGEDYRFPKRPQVDIDFRDIRFTLRKFNFAKVKFESKEILHGLNGTFKSGELNVIMGPSGAGKSTLLNILADYVSAGVSGIVQVNGKTRHHNSQSFKKLSCYIQQHDAIRPYLTVDEAMTIATHLKLGFSVSREEKQKLIQKILFMLGLEQKGSTISKGLSGGQKKRLAIALEMIDNPPILFLDEPTTGLDSSSCTQCISLLKRLAQDGRTIICTIHTPSALIFEMFDKLYTVTQGHCFYQGPGRELLPFLSDLGYHCPSYHNPADFMMEIAVGEYGADVAKIIKAALKKYYEININSIKMEFLFDNVKTAVQYEFDEKGVGVEKGGSEKPVEKLQLEYSEQALAISPASSEDQTVMGSVVEDKTHPASLMMQFLLLVYRNLLQIKRDYVKSKEILHGLNGTFKSGELNVIMGPSGAGKSTLLNILADYVSAGVSGIVQVNGKTRHHNSQSFKKLSCYIQQYDAIRPYLTVDEAMTIATHLKLGFSVSREEKQKLIQKILFMLGLEQKGSTISKGLSGGQKKRLAIALEMIDNPPILFLDEPTTGLDSSSCTQCISLLKRLAQDGRTIICTIHTPSALIFEMFDKLYTVTQGHCFYQGPGRELLPFLSDLGYHCPSYHNPADFMMEIAVGEYGADVAKIIKAALKKYYEININSIKMEFLFDNVKTAVQYEFDEKGVGIEKGGSEKPVEELQLEYSEQALAISPASSEDQTVMGSVAEDKTHPASLMMQFLLLVYRNLLQIKRDYFLVACRLFTHAMIALIFGYIYTGVGPKANTVLANYVYLYGSMLLVVYAGKMAVVLSFPMEMTYLNREHFNRWYKLGPYFFSVLLLEIPIQIACTMLYVLISYYLTGNYHTFDRFLLFCLFCIGGSMAAQAWGFFVGATLPIKLAVFVGPILAVLYSVFGFCTKYVDITPLFRWMWHISYYRAAFHGILNSVYGMNREYLYCPDTQMYCHFKNPVLFQKDMDIEHVDMEKNFILIVSIIVHHVHVHGICALSTVASVRGFGWVLTRIAPTANKNEPGQNALGSSSSKADSNRKRVQNKPQLTKPAPVMAWHGNSDGDGSL
ncbi:LOW QUALITY PROTEIN: ATP-binding cassette sub-family G member 1-like [Uranotaenia lowii]|uniref:LOW QUALITY PROTEIN: ATP-binding cassette sub-family G member 1-like n=1 Tax=Uranotaenia lowii TaxID=190385 RepID=UPI002479F316|nr:LOW QUALITY PROTEIN: ATP-binding cassette sub-family G member 1-like [Uranotaenia lowii]